jgi:hypothetical protein
MTAIWKAGSSFFQEARHVLAIRLGHVLMFIRAPRVAGGCMSRGDEGRTPLRLESDQFPGSAELIRELLSIETAVVGPGVRLRERYAMGLGERRHGYGECVSRRDKAAGLTRTSVVGSRRLRGRSTRDGRARQLYDEWTIPVAVAKDRRGADTI